MENKNIINLSDLERNKDREVVIYIIESNGDVIYVGQTKKFKSRKWSHICCMNNEIYGGNLYVYMRENEYEFKIIDKCKYEDRFVVEKRYIDEYSKKHILYNK